MNRLIGLAAVALVLCSCNRKSKDTAPAIQTAEVGRQNIVIDVEATGVIQPVNAVQVRSKASGQITKMPVELGSNVKPGDLLVQIDPRQVQNLYDQAAAALQSAQANLKVTKTQLDRAEELSKQGVITAPELESAQLAYASAQSQLAGAKTNADNAEISLEDATIRAPISGIVIDKDVAVGQVISSAVNSPNGGTLLLQMADLNQVMDSTLVSESDIGNVRPGLTATVKVDAYPGRVFRGTVRKIAPQATVQQSVTMFPVLIDLDNHDGALLPGMNSDVSILVTQQDNALSIPIDAISSTRNASTAASALGLDPQTVQKDVQAQLASSRQSSSTGQGGSGVANGKLTAGGTGSGRDSAKKSSTCDSLQATLAKHPEVTDKLRSLRQKMRDGSLDATQGRQQIQQLYQSIKVDPQAMRTCMGSRGGAGGPSFSGGSEIMAIGNTPPHPGLVFIQQPDGKFAPRVVTLGVSNYDVSQVLSGLQEGDRVALINAAMLQKARDAQQQRIQSRVGLPGVQSQPSGGGRSGGGGQGDSLC